MKKLLALILAALMVTLAFASCGVEKKENNAPVENNDVVAPEVEGGDDVSDEAPLSYEALSDAIEAFQPMGELDKEVLLTVGGVPFSAASVRYVTQYVNSYFENEEDKNAESESYYRLNAGLVNLCEKYGTGLTQSEVKSQLEAEYQYFKMSFGENYDAEFASSPYTPFFYYFNNAHNYLFSGLFTKLTEDSTSEFSTSIMDASIAEAKASGEYVRVKHILIQFPAGEGENGEVTDAQKAATLEKITEVYNKAAAISAPEEFDALVAEYNEDPGMQSYTGGYCFTSGKMVPEFEQSAFSLEEYGISEPVETTYGYHVLQKLPIEYPGLENTDFISSDIYNYNATSVLMDMILAEAENYEFVYADNYNEKVAEFTAEYEEILAQQMAEYDSAAE